MTCFNINCKQQIIKFVTAIYVAMDFYFFHSIASLINTQYSGQCTKWAKEEGNSFTNQLEESQKEGICWLAGTVIESTFAAAAYKTSILSYEPVMTFLGTYLIGQNSDGARTAGSEVNSVLDEII